MNASSLSTDRAWFRKNPTNNFRIRSPAKGEVEDLIRRQVPDAGYELAMVGGVYPPPSPDIEWQILIIDVGNGPLIRMITLRDKGAPDELGPEGAGTAFAVVLGHRLVIESEAA